MDPSTVITCPTDQDTECLTNTCNPSTGSCSLTPLEDGTSCSDNISCTIGDACVDGFCAPGADNCAECETAADCADFDDGNLCNGIVGCIAGKCGQVPNSAVSCPPTGDPCVLPHAIPTMGNAPARPLPMEEVR